MTCGTIGCAAGFVAASISGKCCPVCVPESTTIPTTATTVPTCPGKSKISVKYQFKFLFTNFFYWFINKTSLDEEFGPCTCTPTCAMIKQGIACDTSVDESGHCCNCLPGMVHDEETGECVEVSDCPCTGKLITVVDSKSKLKYIFAEKPVGELGKCERCVCING